MLAARWDVRTIGSVDKQSSLAERQPGSAQGLAAFISHAKADQKRAQEIAAALEERGLKCWIAPRDVRPGQSYGDEIIRGIEKSRCFILVLSKASNESPFVAREVERAISKRKSVFPIRVEDVEPSSALELFVSSTQWIDAFSRDDAAIDRLANLLAAEEGHGGAPSANAPRLASPARSSGWVRPALLGGAVLLGGLIGAFLWDTYRKTPGSQPPPASVPSASRVEPAQAPQPTSASAPAEQKLATPTAASSDLPPPHAPNEDCSRSGDMTVCASSALTPAQGSSYGPRNLADGDDKTAWVEGSNGQGLGEFVVLEFDTPRMVRGLTIRNGYDKSADIFAKNSRVKDVELRFSSGESVTATLNDQPGPQHLALSQPIEAKWVELVIRSVYPGSKYADTAINEITVDTE